MFLSRHNFTKKGDIFEDSVLKIGLRIGIARLLGTKESDKKGKCAQMCTSKTIPHFAERLCVTAEELWSLRQQQSAALPLTPTQFYIKCCIPIFEKRQHLLRVVAWTYPLLKFKTTTSCIAAKHVDKCFKVASCLQFNCQSEQHTHGYSKPIFGQAKIIASPTSRSLKISAWRCDLFHRVFNKKWRGFQVSILSLKKAEFICTFEAQCVGQVNPWARAKRAKVNFLTIFESCVNETSQIHAFPEGTKTSGFQSTISRTPLL